MNQINNFKIFSKGNKNANVRQQKRDLDNLCFRWSIHWIFPWLLRMVRKTILKLVVFISKIWDVVGRWFDGIWIFENLLLTSSTPKTIRIGSVLSQINNFKIFHSHTLISVVLSLIDISKKKCTVLMPLFHSKENKWSDL